MECLIVLHHSDPFNRLQCIVRGKHHILAPPKQRISGEVLCVIECSCKSLGRWNGCVLSICAVCRGGAFVWKYCTEHCSMVDWKYCTNQAFQIALDLVRKNKSTDVDQALGCCSVRAKHLLLQTHFPDDRSSLITHNLGILLPHG